jgi:hypothetical protein
LTKSVAVGAGKVIVFPARVSVEDCAASGDEKTTAAQARLTDVAAIERILPRQRPSGFI